MRKSKNEVTLGILRRLFFFANFTFLCKNVPEGITETSFYFSKVLQKPSKSATF